MFHSFVVRLFLLSVNESSALKLSKRKRVLAHQNSFVDYICPTPAGYHISLRPI